MFDDVVNPSDIDNADAKHERILALRDKLRNDFNITPEARERRERIISNLEGMEDMPEEHILALSQIDDTQPRSVLALNLLERMKAAAQGETTFTEWKADEPSSDETSGLEAPAPKGPTLH